MKWIVGELHLIVTEPKTQLCAESTAYGKRMNSLTFFSGKKCTIRGLYLYYDKKKNLTPMFVLSKLSIDGCVQTYQKLSSIFIPFVRKKNPMFCFRI